MFEGYFNCSLHYCNNHKSIEQISELFAKSHLFLIDLDVKDQYG